MRVRQALLSPFNRLNRVAVFIRSFVLGAIPYVGFSLVQALLPPVTATVVREKVTVWSPRRLPFRTDRRRNGSTAMVGAWRRPRGEELAPAAETGDAALVRAAQGGDPRAVACLYERYQDPILRFCYYRLGDWEDAGDAAQQVFVDALGALGRFHDHAEGGFRPWLFRIAHNEVANRHRHQTRHPAVPLAFATGLSDRAPTPEASAVTADEECRLHIALSQLPNEQRAVTELRLAGLRGPEIADVLGIGHDAVRKAQSRAVARLRSLLDAASIAAQGRTSNG
jgi:RNA polymerase sigma-70 factor, ECF subfamily